MEKRGVNCEGGRKSEEPGRWRDGKRDRIGGGMFGKIGREKAQIRAPDE